jgi:hypothetical protein
MGRLGAMANYRARRGPWLFSRGLFDMAESIRPCRRVGAVLESSRLEYGLSGSLEKWASPTFLRITPEGDRQASVSP